MGIPILWFRLEGPLQSWGERGRWDHRDTALFPTKSGVVGLIACALGWPRNSPEIGQLCTSVKMAVRADRRGELLTDFHTVQPTGTENRLQTMGRKKRGADKSTIASYRDYLQDASFLVVMAGESGTLEMIQDGLRDPVWTIYLGRKSCVPSVPVIGTITDQYSSLEEAICNIPLIERSDPGRILYEMDADYESMYSRNDLRLSGAERAFAVRYVQVKSIEKEK